MDFVRKNLIRKYFFYHYHYTVTLYAPMLKYAYYLITCYKRFCKTMNYHQTSLFMSRTMSFFFLERAIVENEFFVTISYIL